MEKHYTGIWGRLNRSETGKTEKMVNKLGILRNELIREGHASLNQDKLSNVSLREINDYCGHSGVYKLDDNRLITYRKIKDEVLSFIKREESVLIGDIRVLNLEISSLFLKEVLQDLVHDGLVVCEGTHYRPNLSNLITPDAIRDLCVHRIQKITLEGIVHALGFNTKSSNDRILMSDAYFAVRNHLDDMEKSGFLVAEELQKNVYYWNQNFQFKAPESDKEEEGIQ